MRAGLLEVAMSNCSDFQGWDNFTSDGRRDTLETLINDTLQSEGYEPVNVEVGDLGGYDDDGGGTWAETYQDDDGTITITVDSEHLDKADVQDMVDTSFHEAEHAKQYQDGQDYGPVDEIDAWDAGSAGGVEWEEDCRPDPESSSNGGDDGGDGFGDEPPDLGSVPITPDGIDFDWDRIGAGWSL
jgi:hypothetical protein